MKKTTWNQKRKKAVLETESNISFFDIGFLQDQDLQFPAPVSEDSHI